jgi:hypothetical protein
LASIAAPGAFVRYMHHPRTREMIEHLAGKMLEAAGARRAEVQLAGIRLRITDKFPDVVRGERRINVDRIKQDVAWVIPASLSSNRTAGSY